MYFIRSEGEKKNMKIHKKDLENTVNIERRK